MRLARRALLLILALVSMAGLAPAYYYWTFYASSEAPFLPVPGRFDLANLPDHTVQFFISDQGPSAFVAGDSQTALYSEIQQAADAWNHVPASAIKLRFGGMTTVGSPQSAPGIDVVFDDDMPPGILAQTKPTFPADLSFLPGDPKNPVTFVPMLRSKLQLRSDLTALQQTSFSDSFFLTLVHEFGHSLGLQHTLTSGVMSTAITRATMKGAPLAADDMAGLASLYPAAAFPASYVPLYPQTTGSIAGHVNLKQTGVAMASVVALATSGSSSGIAVSTLTNPDGSYRIDGLPAGSYLLYVHPLPPALDGEASPANIVPPSDPQGDSFAAGNQSNAQFATVFYPATQDWTKAVPVAVAAQTVTAKIDFAVSAYTGTVIHSMEVFGYENGVAVGAPPLLSKTRNAIVFFAYGTTVNVKANGTGQMAAGLKVSVIGGAAAIEPGTLKYYTSGFLVMNVDTADLSLVTRPTPVALAVTLGNELYVLPAAFTVVNAPPPSILSLSQSAAPDTNTPLATVSGSGLTASTKIRLDGAAAQVLSASDDGLGHNNSASMVVAVQPGQSGYTATVEALNPDGQTSLQALPAGADGAAARAVYTYSQSNSPSIKITPSSLTAGQDSWITIVGANTHFAEGRTVVGFGVSDIIARRVWVKDPQTLLVNVSTGAAVQATNATVNIWTGLETVQYTAAIAIAPAAPGQISLQLPVMDAATGLSGVPANGTLQVATTGLAGGSDGVGNALGGLADGQTIGLPGWGLTVDGSPIAINVDKHGTVLAALPAGLAVGPHVLQLIPSDRPAPAPVLFEVVSTPPVIGGAALILPDGSSRPITADAPVMPGQLVLVTATGLDANLSSADQVWVKFGSPLRYPVLGFILLPNADPAALSSYYVWFVLPAGVGPTDPSVTSWNQTSWNQWVALGSGNRQSNTIGITVVPVPTSN